MTEWRDWRAWTTGTIIGGLVALTTASARVAAEEVTITTYFPSPTGAYNEMRTMGDTSMATEGGSVGIGTAVPPTRLTVAGDPENPVGGTCPSGRDWYDEDADSAMDNGECKRTLLATQPTGLVGIGTLTPSAALHVAGAVKITPPASGTSAIALNVTGPASINGLGMGTDADWAALGGPWIGANASGTGGVGVRGTGFYVADLSNQRALIDAGLLWLGPGGPTDPYVTFKLDGASGTALIGGALSMWSACLPQTPSPCGPTQQTILLDGPTGHISAYSIATIDDPATAAVEGDVTVAGNLTVSGTITCPLCAPPLSDARLKAGVVPIADVLGKLGALEAISYEWNEAAVELGLPAGQREIGLSAQDVEAVFPEFVKTAGPHGYKGVDYARFSAVLIEAIKELQVEHQELRERIERLEQESHVTILE